MVLGFPVIPRGDLYTCPHVSGDFCFGKFFYADIPSVHTCPPYTLSRVEISVYAVYPDTCGRSYPYIFVYVDVTVIRTSFFPREIFQNGGEQKRCVFNATRTTFKPNSVSRTKCCNVKSKL